jgi:hypothetical protein
MSLDQIMRQVNLGQAQHSVFTYALSLLANGAMQNGIMYEESIDEKLLKNDVKNVLKKIPVDVYISIFCKEPMNDSEILRTSYDLAVSTYFRFSEGFLQAEKWEEMYSTNEAFEGFALNFLKYTQMSIDALLVSNSKRTCAFTYEYLEKTNQHQSFPIGL